MLFVQPFTDIFTSESSSSHIQQRITAISHPSLYTSKYPQRITPRDIRSISTREVTPPLERDFGQASHDTMKYFQQTVEFDYSWEEVSTSNWRKYGPWNELTPHVIAVDTLSRTVDPQTGIVSTYLSHHTYSAPRTSAMSLIAVIKQNHSVSSC